MDSREEAIDQGIRGGTCLMGKVVALDFALLPERCEENIPSYFEMPISNSAVEGLNNKAKVINRRAYCSRSAKN